MSKTMWHIIPWIAIRRCAEIMTHGMEKYGKDTWKAYDVETQLDAALRHLNAHMEGNTVNDDDWGLNHLDHFACRALMAAQTFREQQLKEQDEVVEITSRGNTVHEAMTTRYEEIKFCDRLWFDAIPDTGSED